MINKIFGAILLLLISINIQAQVVEGYVYERNDDGGKSPLTGASVYWLGTTIGTTTNSKGFFSINVSADSKKLIASYVSCIADTLEYPASNPDKKIVFVLKSSTELNEVVISQRTGAFHSTTQAVQVQKITGDELCKAACCNLSESFETNASVDVGYSDAVTGAKQIELLGLAGKYSQIMTDKIPNVRGLNSTYGLEYIPGSWMKAISISKGVSSVIDGYESITGQINVDFKNPDTDELFFFNTIANSSGEVEVNMNARHEFDTLNKWSTIVFLHGENSFLKEDNNGDGFVDNPSGLQYNFANNWKYFSKKFTSFFGIKALNDKRTGGQYDFDGTVSGLSDHYGVLINTGRYEALWKGAVFFDRKNTSLAFVNSYSYYTQESYIGRNTFDAGQHNFYGNYIFQSYIGNIRHIYNTGLSVVYDDYDETFNDSIYDRTEIVPGAFFQYTWQFAKKGTLLLGVRADYHNKFGMFYTPRINLKYAFPRDYIVRISAGKGYRTANIFSENSYLLVSSRNLVISEDIKQEEAWNYGITLTKKFEISDQLFTFYTEFYRTDFLNRMIVDQDSDESSIYISNLHGKSFSNVFQIELSYRPVKGMETVIAYRWSDAQSTINGNLEKDPLKNDYKGLFNISYRTPNRKWQFDFTTQLNGGGRLPDHGTNADAEFDPYVILNAQITKYFRKWEIYIGGENLTNFTQENPIISADDPFSDTFDASTIWGPMEGIKIFAGMRLKLGEFAK